MPQPALRRKGGRGSALGLTSPPPIASFRAPRLPPCGSPQGPDAHLSQLRNGGRRYRGPSRRNARCGGERRFAGARRGNRQARGPSRKGAGRSLRQPDAVAEDAGGARAGASAVWRLHQGAHHRVYAARRRPLFRRGRSDRRGPRKIRGRVGVRPRPGEGRRHGEPGAAQFRHGAARRATARRRGSCSLPIASASR